MNDCIFCKIARHEVPADILYEDDATVAFLDIKPVSRGHTLVIPKKHAVNIFDADDRMLADTMKTVRRVASVLRDAVDAKGLHISSNHGAAAGQVVFHLHFHLIPRRDRSEFEFWSHEDLNKEDAAVIVSGVRDALA